MFWIKGSGSASSVVFSIGIGGSSSNEVICSSKENAGAVP